MASRDDDDRVGYRRPPKHTRFKPGQSGNPKGRPKHAPNLKTEFLEELGDDVTVRKRKFYWAFSRLKNFACLETRKSKILVHLALNPRSVKLVQGFTRDMRRVGHYGTGDLQVIISGERDFERAKPLMEKAYEGR